MLAHPNYNRTITAFLCQTLRRLKNLEQLPPSVWRRGLSWSVKHLREVRSMCKHIQSLQKCNKRSFPVMVKLPHNIFVCVYASIALEGCFTTTGHRELVPYFKDQLFVFVSICLSVPESNLQLFHLHCRSHIRQHSNIVFIIWWTQASAYSVQNTAAIQPNVMTAPK